MQPRRIKPRFDMPAIDARRVDSPKLGRRARINLDGITPRKVFDTTGEVGRHVESRPPPEHGLGFSETPALTTAPMRKTPRAFRLWSKDEIL